MFCLFAAVTMIPLADLTAITFTAPMFLTVLAMVFLGERIHRFRWTALGIGFVGVLITIGPHLSFAHGASAGVLLALANAVFSAIAMVFLRSMSGGEHAITITFYFSLTFMVCAAPDRGPGLADAHADAMAADRRSPDCSASSASC